MPQLEICMESEFRWRVICSIHHSPSKVSNQQTIPKSAGRVSWKSSAGNVNWGRNGKRSLQALASSVEVRESLIGRVVVRWPVMERSLDVAVVGGAPTGCRHVANWTGNPTSSPGLKPPYYKPPWVCFNYPADTLGAERFTMLLAIASNQLELYVYMYTCLIWN